MGALVDATLPSLVERGPGSLEQSQRNRAANASEVHALKVVAGGIPEGRLRLAGRTQLILAVQVVLAVPRRVMHPSGDERAHA
jgi:hypothetical protein